MDKMPCLGAYALSATRNRDPLITSREHKPIYYSASTVETVDIETEELLMGQKLANLRDIGDHMTVTGVGSLFWKRLEIDLIAKNFTLSMSDLCKNS